MREDEYTEFKKTTGELNEAMISISSILNKHHRGKIYFGLKNDGTPFGFTLPIQRSEMFPERYLKQSDRRSSQLS